MKIFEEKDNNNLDMQPLDDDSLDKVSGGVVIAKSLKCPKCGSLLGIRKPDGTRMCLVCRDIS